MATFTVTDTQLKWYDFSNWWYGIAKGDSTVFGGINVGDYVIVQDSGGNVITEGTVYRVVANTATDSITVWFTTKDFESLKNTGVYLSTDVADYEIRKSITNMVDRATIKITPTEDFELDIGKDVEIWGGGKKILSGIVRHKDIDDRQRRVLEIVSYGDELLRTYVQEVLYNMDVADIVTTLVQKYTDLTVDAVTTGVTIPRLMARDYLAQIVQRLADVVGYQLRVEDKVLHFKPIAYEQAGTILTRSNCIFGEWKKFTDRLVNQVYIVGGYLTFEQTDNFTGDGTTTTFQLTYRPKGDILVTVDGVKQVRDVDYTVDEDGAKITFATAPASGSAIEVKYNYEAAVFLSARDDESIAKYGLFDRKERMIWIKDFDTAKNVARSILRMFSKPEISVKAKMPLASFAQTDIDLGKSVRCVDQKEGVDEYLVVKGLTYNKGLVETDLGTHVITLYEWSAKMQERVRMLELEHLGEDVLTKYYAFIEDVKVKVRQTLFRVKTQQIVGGFRLGKAKLGIDQLGDKRSGWSVYVEEVST